MAWARRNSGLKLAKNQPFLFLFSLSLCRSSHQPGPPLAYLPLTPPHVVSATASQPPPNLEQPPFLSLSLLQNLSPFPVMDSNHCSSQRRRLSHQISLLITTETPALGELLLCQPSFSATILVAYITWPTVHILQIINFCFGSSIFWPSSNGRPGPKKEKKERRPIRSRSA